MSSEEIYSKCSPAIFYIELYNDAGKAISSGSGFFIESSGIAITNYHVIEGASSAKVIIPETKKTYNVTGVYAYDKDQDWAIIQVKGNGFLSLNIGSDESVYTGQKIYTIGSPLGLQNTISEGLLSNKEVALGSVKYYQISAPISHGSSGGALLNEKGQVIGITSASFEDGQNLNLAIPMSYIPLNFDRSKCKSLSSVLNENNFVLPPTNIRIVAQDTDAVYLQWDKVFGADYYYFYYQEDGEDNYWYDTDQNTGEQIRMTYGSDYSAVLYGLENGKTYNIIVTSVKNGVESLDSMIFSFEFISDSNIDILRDVIIKNTISTNGLYKITTGMMEGSSYLYYTALVYDPSEDEIYIECVTSYYSGDQVANFIFLDGAPERVSNNKRVAYFYKEADGTTSVGETVINPKTFKQSSKIFFDYYYSPYGDLVKPGDEGLSTVLTKKCLREANNILAMYGLPFDMTDLGFVIFSAT